MKIIQTEKQLEVSQKPTKYENLKEMHKRGGLDQHEKLLKEYKNLEKGVEGEERLIYYLNTYGDPNWIALKNVWLESYTEFECDLMLFTRPQIYMFEVKNYSGKWELKNNQCFRNGQEMGNNPFSQAQKATTDLRGVFNEAGNPQNLQGILSFVGPNNNVKMHDTVSGIDVRMLNQLEEYIWDIRSGERSYQGYGVDINSVIQTLSPYEIGKPTKEKEIPEVAKNNVQGGICCSRCWSFALKTDKDYLICDCGMHEPKEEAIVRTICEYGVIHHEKNLTTRDLMEFFGGVISESTIYRYLNKHFERLGLNNTTQYLNKGLPFLKLRHEFLLKKPKYLKLS